MIIIIIIIKIMMVIMMIMIMMMIIREYQVWEFQLGFRVSGFCNGSPFPSIPSLLTHVMNGPG